MSVIEKDYILKFIIKKDYNEVQRIEIDKLCKYSTLYDTVVDMLEKLEFESDYLEDICLIKDVEKRKIVVKELIEKNIFEFSEDDEELFYEILRLSFIYFEPPFDYDFEYYNRVDLMELLIDRIFWYSPGVSMLYDNYCIYLANKYGIGFLPNEE